MKKYEVVYKLRDWIDKDKLHWWSLSEHPNAIHLLEQNLDKFDEECWFRHYQNISFLVFGNLFL